MRLKNWRARMLKLHGTEHPEPEYIVFHAPGHLTGHADLRSAFRAVRNRGGVVYRRLIETTDIAPWEILGRIKRRRENGEKQETET